MKKNIVKVALIVSLGIVNLQGMSSKSQTEKPAITVLKKLLNDQNPDVINPGLNDDNYDQIKNDVALLEKEYSTENLNTVLKDLEKIRKQEMGYGRIWSLTGDPKESKQFDEALNKLFNDISVTISSFKKAIIEHEKEKELEPYTTAPGAPAFE